MFELLVPPEAAELEELAGDKKAYDRKMRPRLMVQAIHELQDAGVEADVWKIEGLDRRRIAWKSWPPPGETAGTEWAASFWAAAKTTEGARVAGDGRRGCRVSSASRSAARPSGIR